ncbi:hypothetical protein, partial [Planktotalea arctica]|uniref:hypothetical protein n=1 Tax=Planktotalea arctica TaxID=1481893 RepID=UPI00321A4749
KHCGILMASAVLGHFQNTMNRRAFSAATLLAGGIQHPQLDQAYSNLTSWNSMHSQDPDLGRKKLKELARAESEGS